MADVFEVPELQVAAHANIIRETELSCSQPFPPVQLCAAIRFIYAHLSDQQPLIDTILNYCVFCFLYHGLGTNEDFRRLAFELQPFHRDLCRTSFKRGFTDDGAVDIVRLPVCRPNPHSDADLDKAALGDFLFELWHDNDDSPSDSISQTPESKRRRMLSEAGFILVHRPKKGEEASIAAESGVSSSEDADGFSLVHRPKADLLLQEDDLSSAEVGLSSDEDDHEVLPNVPNHVPWEAESDSDWTVVDHS